MDPVREEKLQELMSFLDNVDAAREIEYLSNLEKDVQSIKMQAVATRDKWLALMQKMFAYKSELMDLSEIDTLSANINLAILSQFADFLDRHYSASVIAQPEVESIEDLLKYIGVCFIIYNPRHTEGTFYAQFADSSIAHGNTLMEVLQKAKAELQTKMGFHIKEDLPLDIEDYETDQVDFA